MQTRVQVVEGYQRSRVGGRGHFYKVITEGLQDHYALIDPGLLRLYQYLISPGRIWTKNTLVFF